MLGSFPPVGGTQPHVRGRTCRSHYLGRPSVKAGSLWHGQHLWWDQRGASACNYQRRALALDSLLSIMTLALLPGLSISQCLLFCNSEKEGSSWLILGSSACVVSLLGVINNSIKISQHTRQAALTGQRGSKGLAPEVPEGPAVGPCPITPTQSWDVFHFSSQAYMCLPSDTMLAVILVRKHVWCSHPMRGAGGGEGTDGTEFQAD